MKARYMYVFIKGIIRKMNCLQSVCYYKLVNFEYILSPLHTNKKQGEKNFEKKWIIASRKYWVGVHQG